MSMNEIEVLNEREHVLKRSQMYLGSLAETDFQDYFLDDESISLKTVRYVPALVKIINEIIDNVFDIAIKTDFKCNKLDVVINDDHVIISDNGTGIPVKKIVNKNTNKEEWMPYTAWGHANAGSNFGDDNKGIGTNGVGSFCTNVWSKKFVGISDDGQNRYTVEFRNNGELFDQKLEKSKSHGVTVEFYPDLERFKVQKLDDVYIDIIRQRLINLNICFPKMSIKLNKKTINVKSFKKYIQMFNKPFEMVEDENYSYAVLPSDSDTFEQISYFNGLKISDGGSHIDVPCTQIVNRLRDKLIKRYKSIKPADIKNKLFIVAFIRNFPNAKFNSQTKEKVTNSIAEINSFINIDYDEFYKKIIKNDLIIDPITEIYKIKEEYKRRQELKSLDKVKKVKDDKYIPPIGDCTHLFICEGFSARSCLKKILGRQGFGYYELKGKPLNTFNKTFSDNKELSVLYQIIKTENYKNIVFASDADLDGFHIRGLLSVFFAKHMADYVDRVGMLQTPVVIVKKGSTITRWFYNLNDKVPLSNGEVSEYKKGLGSWDDEDLQYIISKDGLDKMIVNLDFSTADQSLKNWFDVDSEPRKKAVQENNFSIASV